MFLWAIYIFPRSVCLLCCRKIGGPIVKIYKSLTDTWMWKWELRGHKVSFLGVHKSGFLCSSVADPWQFGLDPDPAIFVIDLRDINKKQIFVKNVYAYYFLKVHLHNFSKIKSLKESQNSRNQDFSYYFWMMIEGSGSIPLTNGSGFGSGRPQNM